MDDFDKKRPSGQIPQTKSTTSDFKTKPWTCHYSLIVHFPFPSFSCIHTNNVHFSFQHSPCIHTNNVHFPFPHKLESTDLCPIKISRREISMNNCNSHDTHGTKESTMCAGMNAFVNVECGMDARWTQQRKMYIFGVDV